MALDSDVSLTLWAAFRLQHWKVIDATRTKDGSTVFIKRTSKDTSELSILRYLTTSDRLRDPRNHCVPLLDFFADDADPNLIYLVMPRLRPFYKAPFWSVDEVVEFIRQTLEVNLASLCIDYL